VKKIVKKTPPARAAMTGAPGKYVIDYYYFVSVGLLAGRIPQGGPFFFWQCISTFLNCSKAPANPSHKYQGQSCNRGLCSKSYCDGRGLRKEGKKKEQSPQSLASPDTAPYPLPLSLTVESVIKMGRKISSIRYFVVST